MDRCSKEKKIFATKWIFIVGRFIQMALQIWLVYIETQSRESSLAAPVFYVILHALVFSICGLTFYFIIILRDRSMITVELLGAIIIFFIHIIYMMVLVIQVHPPQDVLKLHPDHDTYEIKNNLGTLTIVLEVPLVVCVHNFRRLTRERAQVGQEVELNNAAPIQLIQRLRHYLQNGGGTNPGMIADLIELRQAILNVVDIEANLSIILPPEEEQIQNFDLSLPLNVEPQAAHNIVKESIPSNNTLEGVQSDPTSHRVQQQVDLEEENLLHLSTGDAEEHSFKVINDHENVGNDNYAFEHESRESIPTSNGYNIDKSNGGSIFGVPTDDTTILYSNGHQEISVELPDHGLRNDEKDNKLQKRQPSPELSKEIV